MNEKEKSLNQKQKEFFMLQAIELAKKGNGKVSPNPLVGCVIVKNGKIIGNGFHAKYGKAHAEINALNDAKRRGKHAAEGAFVFVTLEPCVHYGKTPPCVNTLIKAKVKKVFIGAIDSNPLVKGKGINLLKKAGIEVESGLMEKECRKLNEFFFSVHEKGRPFIALKAAMSIDGKIADFNGKSKWISGKESREKVHELRNEFDAVLVGKGTVEKDNPRLTCRIKNGRDPIKIIIDPKLETKLNSRIYGEGKTIVACLKNADKKRKKEFLEKGKKLMQKNPKNWIELIELPELRGKEKGISGGHFSMKSLSKELAKKGILSVLAEGGSEVNYSFLKEGIADKIYLFIAPKIIAGNNAKGFAGGKGFALEKAINLKHLKLNLSGKDLFLEAELNQNNES